MRVVVHVFVEWRAYESVDGDAVGEIAEFPSKHRAHAEVAEEDRCPQADRPDPLGGQGESAARHIRLQDRRVFEPDKVALRLSALHWRQHADVGAG